MRIGVGSNAGRKEGKRSFGHGVKSLALSSHPSLKASRPDRGTVADLTLQSEFISKSSLIFSPDRVIIPSLTCADGCGTVISQKVNRMLIC